METIRKHTLNYSGIHCNECVNKIYENISKLPGVKEIHADTSGEVEVEYDLKDINLKWIDKGVSRLGFKRDNGIWSRIKFGYINFTEENERSNFVTKGASCCSDPTEILEKFKK